MKRERAIELVAQAWCLPETSSIVMDGRLASAFADMLVSAVTGAEAERDALKLRVDLLAAECRAWRAWEPTLEDPCTGCYNTPCLCATLPTPEPTLEDK